MNRYTFEAIVKGTCLLQVFANSSSEAKNKVNNGQWELVKDSMETDCNLSDDRFALDILDTDININRKDFPQE